MKPAPPGTAWFIDAHGNEALIRLRRRGFRAGVEVRNVPARLEAVMRDAWLKPDPLRRGIWVGSVNEWGVFLLSCYADDGLVIRWEPGALRRATAAERSTERQAADGPQSADLTPLK